MLARSVAHYLVAGKAWASAAQPMDGTGLGAAAADSQKPAGELLSFFEV